MKKTKQIDAYYCDYCGKECEHTPEFVLPSLEKNSIGGCSPRDGSVIERIMYASSHAEQKDICSKCQGQIAKLTNLLHHAEFLGDDLERTVYVLLKNAKA